MRVAAFALLLLCTAASARRLSQNAQNALGGSSLGLNPDTFLLIGERSGSLQQWNATDQGAAGELLLAASAEPSAAVRRLPMLSALRPAAYLQGWPPTPAAPRAAPSCSRRAWSP